MSDNLLFNLCLAIMLASSLTGFLIYKKLGQALRWIFFAMAAAFLTEIVALIVKPHFTSNMLVFYIADPIEFALLTMFFIKAMPGSGIKILGTWCIIIFFAAAILNLFFFHLLPLDSFYFTIAKGVGITLFSIGYVFYLFSQSVTRFKIDISVLVIAIGLLFYYSFSAVYFSVYNFQLLHGGELPVMQQIKRLLYITYFILQLILLYTFVQIALKKWETAF